MPAVTVPPGDPFTAPALALLTPTTPACTCGHPAAAHRWAAHPRYAGCAACPCWLFLPVVGPPAPWYALAPVWDALCALGDARWARMKDWASCHQFSGPTDRLGTQGEAVWALYSGQRMDTLWHPQTDYGTDFPGLDIKATHYPTPDLLLAPPMRYWAPWYGLVVIDPARQRGRIVGVTPAAPVQAYPLRDFHKGLGRQHWLPARYLLPPAAYWAWLAAMAGAGAA